MASAWLPIGGYFVQYFQYCIHYANLLLIRDPMGWLNDLMLQADPPVRSFAQLAREALGHDGWPAHSRPQPRSLAALFSKLDNARELSWLAERRAVQLVLADLLSCSVADIAQATSPRVAALESPRLLRLVDLPGSRALDLTTDPICPGLPRQLLVPQSWDRSFWHAPSGSGRSLLGQTLAARGLALVYRAGEEPSSAVVDSAAPIYFEASRTSSDALLRSLATRNAPTCIASAEAPPQACAQLLKLVTSPPPASYMAELVQWAKALLPTDGHLDLDASMRWLGEDAVSDGLITSLADAIGMCGLIDEYSLSYVKSKSHGELAASYFQKSLDDSLNPASSATLWLKRAGPGVLVGMFRKLWTDHELDWDEARSFDDWLELVPDEYQRGVDVDWMRLALTGVDGGVRPSDVERAANRLPPGAFRAVQALTDAQLLRRTPGDLLAFGPHWLGNIIEKRALKGLLQGSSFEWGEALLRPKRARRVFTELLSNARQGNLSAASNALELRSEDSPASVASLEACFLALGLATLEGVEFDQEVVDGLYDEQERLLVQIDDELPYPRVLPFADANVDSHEFSHGAWLLAALAISEQLSQRRHRHELLCPWHARDTPSGLTQLYDTLETALGSLGLRWQKAAIRLIDRLRSSIGSPKEEPHRLERALQIVDEVEHDVLELQSLRNLTETSLGLPALEVVCIDRGVSLEKVLEKLWQAWFDADRPLEGFEYLDPTANDAPLFWGHLPPELLAILLSEGGALSIPFAVFNEAQWEVVVLASAERPLLHEDVEFWQHLPFLHVSTLIESDGLGDERWLRVLWTRFPQALSRLTRKKLNSQPEGAVPLLSSAPEEQCDELVRWLSERVAIADLPRDAQDATRRWLSRQVAKRGRAWRKAYQLLCTTEEALRPLRQAR